MVRVTKKPSNVGTHLPVHSARKFTWTGFVGAAEASDFNAIQTVGRVWRDACDEGFWVESPKTNERILFTLAGFEQDRDGEVLAWKFEAFGTDRPLHIKLFNT